MAIHIKGIGPAEPENSDDNGPCCDSSSVRFLGGTPLSANENSEVAFLTYVQVTDLQEKMIRLDQLGNFQDKMRALPKELQTMID